MKKTIISLLIFLSAGFQSCNYLDINPELGIDEKDVFSSYQNYKAFFETVYEGQSNLNIQLGVPLYIDFNNMRFAFYSTTDAADCGRLIRPQAIKKGSLGLNTIENFTTNTGRRPISRAMFKVIRTSNQAIANIDLLQNATDQQKWDILGQAYFIRAYAHFTLVRYFGGMPYLDQALGEEDEWDLGRLPANTTLHRCAADLDVAYDYLKKAGKMRRDALPGESGHLTGTDMFFPNGVAAKAMKSRVLLYAASPLNNLGGEQDWKDAAQACAEALVVAQEWKYDMVPASEWNKNYWGTLYTNEEIWAWNAGSYKINHLNFAGLFGYPQTGQTLSGGTCPTQNMVDMFETKDGDALNSEEDRAEAVRAGRYKEQDPYSNRDPRFELTVVHDGSIVSGATKGINIYYDPATKTYPTTTISSKTVAFGIDWGSDDAKGYTNTGYYLNKGWNGYYGTASTHQHTDPLFRVAELYLNYAEAVNEAYGPDGTAGELSLTAEDALNKVRARFSMPEVQSRYLQDRETFRGRIHNERNVELAFEGHHYYFDIRRWKTAPVTMTQPLTGMYIEKVAVSAEYPKGRKYIRRNIPAGRQCSWKQAMYYFPFPPAEANKMQNFVNNEIW